MKTAWKSGQCSKCDIWLLKGFQFRKRHHHNSTCFKYKPSISSNYQKVAKTLYSRLLCILACYKMEQLIITNTLYNGNKDKIIIIWICTLYELAENYRLLQFMINISLDIKLSHEWTYQQEKQKMNEYFSENCRYMMKMFWRFGFKMINN